MLWAKKYTYGTLGVATAFTILVGAIIFAPTGCKPYLQSDNPNAFATRKLELEIAELEYASSWKGQLVSFIPLVSTSLGLLGFVFGVFQYSEEQKQKRFDEKERDVENWKIAEKELMKPWLERQRETYSAALEAASLIATSQDQELRDKAIATFRQLYHGQMILIETKQVSDDMVSFDQSIDCKDESELQQKCLQLATSMADSMAKSAKMKHIEFMQHQYHYLSGKVLIQKAQKLNHPPNKSLETDA